MTTQARKFLSWLAIAASVLGLLAACGGGGDSDNELGSSAEGAYSGPMAGDPGGRNVFNLLVLENNVVYGLYGTDMGGGVLAVDGFLQGNASGVSSSFTAANSVSFFGSNSAVTTPFVSTYTASTVTGTITQAAAPASVRTFVAGDIPTGIYNYNTAASTAAVSGAFNNLQDLTGKPTSITITGGTFNGTTGTCSFSGTLFPRASGKNVFDVTVTFGAAPCDFPGVTYGTFTGVAISLTLAGPTQELLLTAVNASRTRGVAFVGTR